MLPKLREPASPVTRASRRGRRAPSRRTPPEALDADLPVLIHSVKVHGFEGLVAERRSSAYEPGLRSGAWMKMRVNRGQEFAIGGYTRGTKTFDAIVFGYDEGDRFDLRRQNSERQTMSSRRLMTECRASDACQ